MKKDCQFGNPFFCNHSKFSRFSNKMTNFYYLFLLFLYQGLVFGQNLVPNGSFEEFKKCPNAISQFGYVFDWKGVGSNATPDLYSYCSHYTNASHPESNRVRVKPKDGQSYAGLVIFVKEKEDYREYIGVKLYSKLIKDSTYTFRISLAVPIKSTILNHNFDIVFTNKLLFSKTNQGIILKPSFRLKIDTLRIDRQWETFEFDFKAKGDERFLQIGNFKKKDANWNFIENRKKTNRKDDIFAYLLIDDIQLFLKYPKVVEPMKTEETIVEKQNPKKTFVFDDLKFKTNSYELLYTNLYRLDSLADYLIENESIHFIIEGHTDNQGDFEKNKILSLDRANTVAEYLIYKGISSYRIITIGLGSTKPIAENDSESGRLANRRVEITFVD